MPGTWLLGSEVTHHGDGDAGPGGARAVLLGLRDGDAGPADPLDELARLAETDGVAVVDRLPTTADAEELLLPVARDGRELTYAVVLARRSAAG